MLVSKKKLEQRKKLISRVLLLEKSKKKKKKKRNIIVFEDVQFSLVRLKSSFLRTLSSWVFVICNMDHTLIRLL